MKERNQWLLASALKMKDSDSCFSIGSIQSQITFSWDPGTSTLIVNEQMGFGVNVPHRLLTPPQLVAAFLIRCKNADFNRAFLEDFYPTDDALETVRAGEAALEVSRSKHKRVSGVELPPRLALKLVGDEKQSPIFLNDGLRGSLARSVRLMSESSIRERLCS